MFPKFSKFLPTAIIICFAASSTHGSNLRNSIISRIYFQSTVQYLAEEVRMEIPFTVMTNVEDYPINQIPTILDNNLLHNTHGHEILLLSVALFVFIAKYQVCVPPPSTIKLEDMKRLYPFINFDEIYNQTKTALLLILILFFKNVPSAL